MESHCLMGRISAWDDENVLEINSGAVTPIVNVLNTNELYT